MAKTDKPNILILWGDDIGIWNISHFSRGMMGYRTPNIDRIAKEGVTFTDYYAQQSCTAGRACFICGQNPIRTGLTKVGMPGATVGLQKEDPTIAELLKPLGYATGQFGKNHLGDRDEYPADRARLRRVLRQPLSPERRGRTGAARLSQGSGVQEEVRPARRAPLRGRRQGRADDQGHRPADQEAHGDDRRGDHRARARLDGEAGQGGQAVLPLVQLDGDALPHARRRKESRQERAGPLQRSHGRPRRADRPDARQARRAGHRRQHHRHVLDRQRPGERHLAGRRQHAVPQPEGHQLGGRLARAVLHALAGQDQGRTRC